MLAFGSQGFIAIGAIVCALIGYFMGVSWKGRPWLGAILGFFLGVIGLIIFAIIPKESGYTRN